MIANNRKDLVLYFRNQIEELGFIGDEKTASKNYFNFGGFKAFSLERYTIEIIKLNYDDDSWTLRSIHFYPVFSEKDKPRKIIMNGSTILKETVIGNITSYSSMELDIYNITDFLKYISNIDVVKNYLRKNKLKKINDKILIR